MTSAERTARLSELGRQIATELHNLDPIRNVWTFVEPTEDTYSVYLRNAGQARIYLQFDGYNEPTRLSISGWQNVGKNNSYVEVYERGADDTGWNRVTAPSITVALSRGCEAIAKDIAKRFLPEYLRIFALAQEKVAADKLYEETIAKNRARLAACCGVPVSNHCRSEFSWHHGGYHTVQVSKATCDLKLSDLTFEQAEHIIGYLKAQPTKETD